MRHRPEDHAVRRLGGFDRAGRQGGALARNAASPMATGVNDKAEPECAVGIAQHGEGGGGNLRPDAVALHDDEAHRRGGRGVTRIRILL